MRNVSVSAVALMMLCVSIASAECPKEPPRAPIATSFAIQHIARVDRSKDRGLDGDRGLDETNRIDALRKEFEVLKQAVDELKEMLTELRGANTAFMQFIREDVEMLREDIAKLQQ